MCVCFSPFFFLKSRLLNLEFFIYKTYDKLNVGIVEKNEEVSTYQKRDYKTYRGFA